jgi:hypothetical protein
LDSQFIVGIDLGTTNSAMARIRSSPGEESSAIELENIPQLVNPNEVADRTLLPSFLYIPGEMDFPKGSLKLPWDKEPKFVIGELARKRGAENPVRLVASANVAYQNQIADFDSLAPTIALGLEPGIKRSLRLLKKGHVLQAGLLGCAESQLASLLIERSGHG